MKEPHMALFVAPTGVGKTQLALDLIEQKYLNHSDYNIIICTTLQYNVMYRSLKWFWTDPYVTLIELGNRLYNWFEMLGNDLAGSKTFLLIDDTLPMKLSISKKILC